MKTIKVRLTLTEEALGMSPTSAEVHKDYIAAKAPDAPTMEQEVAEFGVDVMTEKGMTVFPRMDDGTPYYYNYQIRGMFKDACGMLRRIDGTESKKCTAYKKVIDGTVFVNPRQIPIILPEGGEFGKCERPLRAQTAQGERVALASSETVPVGSTLEFEIELLNSKDEKLVLEWLDYGKYRGLGQWRNSGRGLFTYDIIENNEKDFSLK